MKLEKLALFAALFLLAAPLTAEAQPATAHRIGVVLPGASYYAVIDGLRDGLREFRLEEGKHFVFDIRDGRGDLAAIEKAAQDLERAHRAGAGEISTVTRSCDRSAAR